MSCQTSTSDVFACVSLSIGLFGTSLIPFFLLVEAEHLTPRFVRELPTTVRQTSRDVALSAAVVLLLLTAPKGATQ